MEKQSLNRLLLRPTEAAEILGFGRSRLYELLASGQLPSIKVGKSIRVPTAALEKWVADQLAK
jgi:excisionase family DNA binding protein